MQLDIEQFIATMRQISDEKNISMESVVDALENALAAAYRRDYGSRDQQYRIELNMKNGSMKTYRVYDVVEEVENAESELTLDEAKKKDPAAKVGGTVEEAVESAKDFGRVAAQTAKQVILQKLREAERDVVFSEYSDKVGTVLNGTVQRVEPRVVYVDLGRAQGIIPASEQIPGERYRPNQRLKVFLRDVETGPRGPQLILSRANEDFIRILFEREVPEMENNAVEIRALAREPGARTKVAVASNTPGVDPVGTFVGGHGTRVQAVMGELSEEKIDIIMFDEDPMTFIKNALSPTQIAEVKLHPEDQTAEVMVPTDQLSIGIGKQGQNVRLASRLTGWQIDIKASDAPATAEAPAPEVKAPVKKKLASKSELEASLIDTIESTEPVEAPTEAEKSEEE